MEKIWKGLNLPQAARERAQAVQCLPCEFKNLDSTPRIHIKELGVIAGSGVEETGGSPGLAGQSPLLPYSASGIDSVIGVNSRAVGWQTGIVAALSRGPGSVMCKSHGGL